MHTVQLPLLSIYKHPKFLTRLSANTTTGGGWKENGSNRGREGKMALLREREQIHTVVVEREENRCEGQGKMSRRNLLMENKTGTVT